MDGWVHFPILKRKKEKALKKLEEKMGWMDGLNVNFFVPRGKAPPPT